ncbi:MAG: S8 family serine peptidase [Lachnospiraceae bacterium]
MRKNRFFAFMLSAILAIITLPISKIQAAEETVDVILTLSQPSMLQTYIEENSQNKAFSDWCRTQKEAKESITEQIEKVEAQIQEICEKDGVKDELEIQAVYNTVCSAIALTVPKQELEKLETVPGVKAVMRSEKYAQIAAYTGNESDEARDAAVEDATSAVETEAGFQTGQGQTIAILDTGVEASHEAFQTVPQGAKYDAQAMNTLLEQEDLICVQQYRNTLTAKEGGGEDSVYKSEKIPFSYDYADNTTGDEPKDSHGTQMAGIAAGCGADYAGVAEDAQILSMQIYNEKNETSDICLLSALQDAVSLDADVICINAGAVGGYSTDSDTLLQEVYETMESAGITVIADAGETTQAADSSVSVMQIDTGEIGKNASNQSVLAVASQKQGGAISAFSAEGTDEELHLKPDLTAVGERVKAPTITEDRCTYQTVSGTAFAAAQTAGAAAVLKSALCAKKTGANAETVVWSAKEKQELETETRARLLSSAQPIESGTPGIYTSVRCQGAGALNLSDAVSQTTYLTVSGNTAPKVSLGARTDGIYTFSAVIHNMAAKAQTYQLSATVQAQKAVENKKGELVQTQEQENLLEDAAYVAFSGAGVKNGAVTVPAQGSRTVKVTVQLELDSERIASMQDLWRAGFFIEGYFFAQATGAKSVSVPYLGFHGDLNFAPLFDGEEDCKVFDGNALRVSADDQVRYGTNLFQALIEPKIVQSATTVLDHTTKKEMPILLSRLSTNQAATCIYPHTCLLRGAQSLTYQLKNASGKVEQTYTVKQIPRTFLDETTKKAVSVEERLGSYGSYYFNCADADNASLKDGTYTLSIIGKPAGIPKDQVKEHKLTYAVILDHTKPTVTAAQTYLYEKNSQLYLHVAASDNQILSGMQLCATNTEGEKNVLLSCAWSEKTVNENAILLGNKTDILQNAASGTMQLTVYDGALNTTTTSVAVQEEGTESEDTPLATTTAKLKKEKTGTLSLSWKKVKNADGYLVYRGTAKNGTYKKIAKTKKLTYTDTSNLTYGKKYYYRVRPYKISGTKTTYGDYSSAVCATCTILRKPEVYWSSVDKTHLFFCWNRISGAKGYELYRSSKINGTYKRVRVLKNAKIVNSTEKVKSDTLYYYKLRAVTTENGQTKKSQFSDIQTCIAGEIEG